MQHNKRRGQNRAKCCPIFPASYEFSWPALNSTDTPPLKISSDPRLLQEFHGEHRMSLKLGRWNQKFPIFWSYISLKKSSNLIPLYRVWTINLKKWVTDDGISLKLILRKPVAYQRGFRVSRHPPPEFWRPSKIVPNSTRLWKLLKIAEFRAPTPQDVRKKGSKFLKLPRFEIVLH